MSISHQALLFALDYFLSAHEKALSYGRARCDTHELAEQAIKRLQHCGYDMQQFSIVGRDHHSEKNVVGYYNVGNRRQE